jgi:predicted nucleic acid-binding protein
MKGTKYVSSVTIHELYKLSMEKEGRGVAETRVALIEKDFEVISVDTDVAKKSAELRSKYRIPMADSMVAASAQRYRLSCMSDDPHLSMVEGLDVRWI